MGSYKTAPLLLLLLSPTARCTAKSNRAGFQHTQTIIHNCTTNTYRHPILPVAVEFLRVTIPRKGPNALSRLPPHCQLQLASRPSLQPP